MSLWMPGDLEADQSWRVPCAELGFIKRVETKLDTFGFVVVEGVDTKDYGMQAVRIASHFGTLLPQDREGREIWRVENLDGDARVKSSKRNEALMLHNDRASGWLDLEIELVAMLAVRTSEAGGESLIASTDTIRQIMQTEFPDWYDVLTEPFAFERGSGIREGQTPFFISPVFAAGGSDVHISTPRIRAIEEHGLELSPEQRKALDCLEEVLTRREIALQFHLQPGEMLLTNERRVLHGRTAFDDGPVESQRRLLLRMWLGSKKQPNKSTFTGRLQA